jgi:hypothetical protein
LKNNDGKSDAGSLKKNSKTISLNFVFKEKSPFILSSGQEQLSLKIYSSNPITTEGEQSVYEKMEQEYLIKVSNELV